MKNNHIRFIVACILLSSVTRAYSTVVDRTFRQLVEQADAIVEGVVKEQADNACYDRESRPSFRKKSAFAVSRVHKGDIDAEHTIAVFSHMYHPCDMSCNLTEGSRYLLMLKDYDSGFADVHYGRGVFAIVADESTGEVMINDKPYEEFVANIAGVLVGPVSRPEEDGRAQLEILKTVLHGYPLGTMHETTLDDGVTALTVVFRETRWESKEQSQIVSKWFCTQEDAMALPEAERLKKLNKIDNHIQVWLVPLHDMATSPTELKKSLPISNNPHEHYREKAFVGKDHRFAWFAYAPIPQWIRMQQELELQDGDDYLAAAIRGTTIEDRGDGTRNSCLAILGGAGPTVIPYIDAAIEDGHPQREMILRNLYGSKSKTVTQWLVRQATAEDEAVRRGARHCLIHSPRRGAMPLYQQWLSAEAGTSDVYHLLKACRAVEMPGLRDLLPQVLVSPSSVREYRLAFELQRELSSEDIPPAILNCEKTIRQFGYASGKNYSQEKVDNAIIRILASNDQEAVATIALSLAIAITKGDIRPVRAAGVRILRALPDGKGMTLVSKLLRSCDDTYQKKRFEEIATALRSHNELPK